MWIWHIVCSRIGASKYCNYSAPDQRITMSQAAFTSAPSAFGRSPAWSRSLPILLSWVQGVYYLLTGVWPLVSIRTFQIVTGVKTDNLPTGREADHWLVMAVGVLITAIAL